MKHGRKTVTQWGSEPPVVTVAYEEPLGNWDSGFSVLFADAPTEDELEEDIGADEHSPMGLPHPSMSLACLHCVLDDHPEIGRGLDVAREYGVAELDENGEWVATRADSQMI